MILFSQRFAGLPGLVEYTLPDGRKDFFASSYWRLHGDAIALRSCMIRLPTAPQFRGLHRLDQPLEYHHIEEDVSFDPVDPDQFGIDRALSNLPADFARPDPAAHDR